MIGCETQPDWQAIATFAVAVFAFVGLIVAHMLSKAALIRSEKLGILDSIVSDFLNLISEARKVDAHLPHLKKENAFEQQARVLNFQHLLDTFHVRIKLLSINIGEKYPVLDRELSNLFDINKKISESSTIGLMTAFGNLVRAETDKINQTVFF